MKFDINRYKQAKNEVKQMFLNEKLGNQQSYESQAKLFKPLIDTTRETTKTLEQKIGDNNQNLSNLLVPFTNQLIRANDQREAIQAMPFYDSPIPTSQTTSTPKTDTLIINLDKDLNESDKENLDLLDLKLPSEVYESNEIQTTLEEIKTINRRLGQFMGSKSKKTPADKAICESQQKTLEKYKSILTKAKAGSELLGEGLKKKKKLVKVKRGRGRPKGDQVVFYQNPNQLVQLLHENLTALKAGNNGVYNTAVGILDELLKIRVITKEAYDDIYKNNFSNNIKWRN